MDYYIYFCKSILKIPLDPSSMFLFVTEKNTVLPFASIVTKWTITLGAMAYMVSTYFTLVVDLGVVFLLWDATRKTWLSGRISRRETCWISHTFLLKTIQLLLLCTIYIGLPWLSECYFLLCYPFSKEKIIYIGFV